VDGNPPFTVAGALMETRSVSRCVAIAAHGKRCQQSPFRGSPYCWHHTQSRKIWAPSRPLGTAAAPAPRTGGPAEPASEDERRTHGGRRARADRRGGWSPEEAVALRLAEVLGPARVEELLNFLETAREGAFLIVKDAGGVFTEQSVAPHPTAQRRSA
jgi:hypothetical protein